MQTEQERIDPALRQRLLEAPDAILGDEDLMRALIAAGRTPSRGNVVDLRGVAMDRLEGRMALLEETHRTVIAAAYENLTGTKQVHRAILVLIEQTDFESFIRALAAEVTDLLRVSTARLVLESASQAAPEALRTVGDVVRIAEPGFIDSYLTRGRGGAVKPIVLRATKPGATALYGEGSDWVASEALLRLDIGPGRYPAMLVLASDDAQHFAPVHGTELLAFFGGVFEQLMRRWLG